MYAAAQRLHKAPPSSEDGEEDRTDDITPNFVWGTHISVQDDKSAIEMFVKHFRKAKESCEDLFREGKLMASIWKVVKIEGEWIDVEAPLEVLAIEMNQNLFVGEESADEILQACSGIGSLHRKRRYSRQDIGGRHGESVHGLVGKYAFATQNQIV